jgi:hypothetical protein
VNPAIVGKALADPLANRLQRVFGISQLKIDPAFTSGSDLPQAKVTLQQQVATNLTFTYVTALEDPNSQIIPDRMGVRTYMVRNRQSRLEWHLQHQPDL